MYDDRLVIPKGIRDRVLDVLHAARQGRFSMLHRAAQTVFWLGYTANIKRGKRAATPATPLPLLSSRSPLNNWNRPQLHSKV